MTSANKSLEGKNFLHDFFYFGILLLKNWLRLRRQFKLNVETRSFTAWRNSRGNINPFTTFKPLDWKCYKTIGSYVSCVFIEIWSTWEVWRAHKKLEVLSATPRATLTHLSCPPPFRCYLKNGHRRGKAFPTLKVYIEWTEIVVLKRKKRHFALRKPQFGRGKRELWRQSIN